MPIKPLYGFACDSVLRSQLYQDYTLRTVYLSNYQARSHMGFPSWIKPAIVISLNSLITPCLPTLLHQAVVAFKEGKLRRPIEKTHCEGSRSSRSASASTVPPTQRSGETDSETLTSFNDASTPSEKASNRSHLTRTEHSSSERDLSFVLRREAQQILERNKNFLDPAMVTWDSSSSKSPNTSGSKDFGAFKAEHSFYDDPNVSTSNGYYFSNGCYYPIPVICMYPQQEYFRTDPVAVPRPAPPPAPPKYRKNSPPRTVPVPALSQQSKPFVPKREEVKKLDPAAPAFDQKKKTYANHAAKEEKKEFPQKAKPVRKPLGNAAGNTIRQILNRNRMTTKVKPQEQIEKRELSDPRKFQTTVPEQDDNDIQSDVYAPEEIVCKKTEVKKKQRFHTKKRKMNQPQNLLAKRLDAGKLEPF